jgi:hypothetical protein
VLFAAAVLAAGWPALTSSIAAVGTATVSGDKVELADQAVPTSCPAGGQFQWSGHPFAVPNPGQSHQGQIPPVRLALTFGDSAWNAGAADVCGAVVVTSQRLGAGVMTRRLAPQWGSLQVQEVRLQI